MTRLTYKQLPEKYKKLVPHRTFSKYKAKRATIDGYKFDSQKEANRYQELKQLKQIGDITFFIRQPMFDIGAGVTYKADFLIFWNDGSFSVEDVKGYPTQVFKLKHKFLESNYPFKLNII